MNQSPHPKGSGRRRNGRNGTPHKTYASENDAASYRHHQQQHLSDSPFTPQKGASNGNPLNQPHPQSTAQKQRPRNSSSKKPRNKQDRHSPSEHPPAPLAFAGASFHASPAPGSLPMPSFLARATSAPDSPSLKSPHGPSQEPSPPTTDSEENGSPTPPLGPEPSRAFESPLEFFFKADRAEKARTRRASSANIAAVAPGPFSPPHDSHSPRECRTLPKANGFSQQPARPAVQRNPSSGIPSSELDGTPGRPVGHAFSTPYSERIKAARSKNGSALATPSAPQNDDTDRSEALKRFLGVGAASAQQIQQPRGQQHHAFSPGYPQAKTHRGVFPASVLNGSSSPQHAGAAHSAPVAAMGSPGHYGQVHVMQSAQAQFDPEADNVRKMEDSLRRVLKLGPA
ncbi:hypothetical protein JX266_012059 [Neoarthrinium moseri]|nr:hypothetical protein JX266_012059 [Neoarthrinium moseri]